MPVRMPNLVALTALAMAPGRHHSPRAEEIRSGASDTEIKIGNIMPYSGPASSYGVIGKTKKPFSR